MQTSALCRSRRELSNAYLLAKFGLDTAENEPCQVCPTKQCSSQNSYPSGGSAALSEFSRREVPEGPRRRRPAGRLPRPARGAAAAGTSTPARLAGWHRWAEGLRGVRRGPRLRDDRRGALAGVRRVANQQNFAKFCQILADSFSAVSKPNFAAKYSLESS